MGWYDSVRGYYYTWGCHFQGKYDKLIAYGIILLLGFFSILDTCLTWGNYYDFQEKDYHYALVTGHAGSLAVQALFVLSLASAMFCIIECVNILSIMTNGGHARIPVELEQAVVLLCEGIPVSAVNLSIVMCRHDDASAYQIVGGCVIVMKSAIRMYFYGWFKERQFKMERSMYKWTLKLAIYLTATSTWLMLFIIQCFLWHHSVTGGIHSAKTELTRMRAMERISILLVSRHDFDHNANTRHISSYFSHDIRYCQSDNRISFSNDTSDEMWVRPILVGNISKVIASGEKGYTTTFPCETQNIINNTVTLSKCKDAAELKFKFIYSYKSRKRRRQPYGEIRYNIAKLWKGKCEPFQEPLLNDWELHYFRIFPNEVSTNSTEFPITTESPRSRDLGRNLGRNRTESPDLSSKDACSDAYLEQAWVQLCFPPIPHYDPRINVCK